MTSSQEIGIPLNPESKSRVPESDQSGILLRFRDWMEPILVGTTLLALLLGLGVRAVHGPEWAVTIMAVISYAAGGSLGLGAGISSLREGQINVDLLMILAAIGAVLIGSWP